MSVHEVHSWRQGIFSLALHKDCILFGYYVHQIFLILREVNYFLICCQFSTTTKNIIPTMTLTCLACIWTEGKKTEYLEETQADAGECANLKQEGPRTKNMTRGVDLGDKGD